MDCPSCRSQDAARNVESIYSGGTQTSVTHSTGHWSGMGYGRGGAVWMGGPTNTTEVTRQSTALAALLAPPWISRPGHAFRNLVLIIGIPWGLLCYAVGLGSNSSTGAIFALLMLAVALAPLFGARWLWLRSKPGRKAAAKATEKREFELKRYRLWQQTWYCARCHLVFWPTGDSVVQRAQIAHCQRPEHLRWSLDRLTGATRGYALPALPPATTNRQLA
ncbi:MAG: hypothetical protein ACYDGR_09800 [Candidatus Dormibacteria bacterium]